ncbi:MAG: DUF1761 domain-containing protein [Candidatus Doudnabacteria bacterium]|nr:DUF1761 domain-containing protein [Candidatus Doudnabacteria bacterium]
MQEVPVNYWAILVCGIASLVLGFIYYGPLFGKLYSRLMGWENMDPARSAEMKKGMNKRYAMALLGSLLMAFVLAHSLVFAESYMKVSGVAAGLQAAVWSWLGFIVPVTLGNVLWGGQSWKLWFLGNGYQLIQLLIFGIILGTWK